ncbi:MAG: hypothetical protein KDD06_16145 [Phaeodactylibacter sp.]|nr:hypothetical protein [Phaeodactylibacter sp.]MCB9267159.1 hypothetical protein [Lewinellaceae bacterium]MCB9289934.1 hypothetical protein [Lewinellaceae bacterium]
MKLTVRILFFLIPISLTAHPISISWATLHAAQGKIGVQLNVLAEDLFLYHGLEADSDGFFTARQLSEAAEKHKAFLRRYFFLESLQGQRLSADLPELQSSDIPERGIHKDSLMQHSLLYFFEIKTPLSLDGVQIHQEFGGRLSPIPALVMVTAYQEGGANSLTAEVSREKPCILRFSWNAPELFARDKGFAHFAAKEAPSATIYIDEAGLRQDVVLPFEKLETLLPLTRKEPSRFSDAETQEAQQKVITFFSERIKAVANGQAVAPSSARVEFGGQPASSEGKTPSLLPDTPVKISLIYSTAPSPSSVSITWGAFNWQARSWKAEIQAFGKKESHTFSRYRPEYVWMK